jgi:hypothetical protein
MDGWLDGWMDGWMVCVSLASVCLYGFCAYPAFKAVSLIVLRCVKLNILSSGRRVLQMDFQTKMTIFFENSSEDFY